MRALNLTMSLLDFLRADANSIEAIAHFGGVSEDALLAAAQKSPQEVVGGAEALTARGIGAEFTRAGLARCIAAHAPQMRNTTAFSWATGAQRDLYLQSENLAAKRAAEAAAAIATRNDVIAEADRLRVAARRYMAEQERIGYTVDFVTALAHVRAQGGEASNPIARHAPGRFWAVGGDVYTFDAGTAVAINTKARNFRGVAYGGGIVTDHPLYDRVAFDLSSTRLSTPAPALYVHRADPVGIIRHADVTHSGVTISGELFSDIDEQARDIATKADRGMPWQLSVGIFPGRVDEIGAGVALTLNGRPAVGPLTVFRDNRIREVSFVPLGADHTTAAEVL